jgi:hypothetical protein
VCARLLDDAAAADETRVDLDAYQLMRGVGNLCIGEESDALRRAAWSRLCSTGSGSTDRSRPARPASL